jgi:hypothetical protein
VPHPEPRTQSTDMTDDADTRRPNTSRVRILLGTLLLAAATTGAWQLRDAGTNASTTERLATCEALQPDSDNQAESVVVCLTQTLVDAAEKGTYPEILALTESLRRGRLQASCHAAGHRAGLELYDDHGMAAALGKIFPTTFSDGDAPVDYICTSAVVHGLVGGGEADGSDPADVARNCVSLDRVEPRYTHECAHFYGHGVWRRVGTLGEDIVQQCDLLAGGVTGLAPEICVTGAVMQKYDLQTKHYDPFNEEAKKRETPSREELETLCDTVTGSTSFTNGCHGAVGWLAAMRAQDTLDEFDENSAAYRTTAIEAYTTELGICRKGSTLQEQCVQNFITHFRPQAYHDGIAREVCEIVGVDRNRCERVIALRTGTTPAGTDGATPPLG